MLHQHFSLFHSIVTQEFESDNILLTSLLILIIKEVMKDLLNLKNGGLNACFELRGLPNKLINIHHTDILLFFLISLQKTFHLQGFRPWIIHN